MINIRNVLARFLVLSVLILCFIWPIPNDQIFFHRNGLIYNIIFISLLLFFSSSKIKKKLNFEKTKFVFVTIFLLTILILINGCFVTLDIKGMISSWKGQWLRPIFLLFAGIIIFPIIQYHFPSISIEKFFTLVILCFWGTICIHLLDTVWIYFCDSTIHLGKTRIVYNRTRMSFQVNMITGFLLTEILIRSLLRQRFLILNTLFLNIILCCNLGCTILINTRLGTIGLMGSLFSAFILLIVRNAQYERIVTISSILFGIITISIFLGYISWNTDPRWNNLVDDIFVGWNAPLNSFCYIKSSSIIPTNNSGRQMNHSNGCRASFFHQGWKLINKYPAGIGPHKEAFGYILRLDTHDNRITVTHSHCGLIEFGIQNGIAGIIGWLILLSSFWHIGWNEYRFGTTVIGMFLLLFTINFFSRTIVDHNLKDHYLEQYLFITGLLIGICVLQKKVRDSYSLK